MRGFTLIELLVVLAISGLLMSLVGPVAIEQYERSQFLKEREQLLRILEHSRSQAFINRSSATLSFKQYSVSYQQGNTENTWQFSRLLFSPQQLSVNGNGFWQQTSLSWQEQQRSWQLTLNPEPVQYQLLVRDPVPQRAN
ncbi:pilus assembly FimT family protein [Alishewanella longhuensis]